MSPPCARSLTQEAACPRRFRHVKHNFVSYDEPRRDAARTEARQHGGIGPFDAAKAPPRLAVEHLFDHRRVVSGRRGHPLSGARLAAELADARSIRPTPSMRQSEAEFETFLLEIGVPDARIVMHARSSPGLLIALIESDPLSVLPQQWLELETMRFYGASGGMVHSRR